VWNVPFLMNITRRRCGVSVILVPLTNNILTYLLTYSHTVTVTDMTPVDAVRRNTRTYYNRRDVKPH